MSERWGSSTNGRPLKPTLAPNRNNVRSPMTPRLAASASPSVPPTGARRTPIVRAETSPVPPSLKRGDTPSKDALSTGNITPRSSARKSRADISATTPEPSESPLAPRIRQTTATSSTTGERASSAVGVGSNGTSSKNMVGRPNSTISDNAPRAASPLIRPPGSPGVGQQRGDESIDSHFFHASEGPKQESASRKVESKKAASFFYADGKEEGKKNGKGTPPRAASPVLSAVSEKRANAPWLRSGRRSNPSTSPPVLSPAGSAVSNSVSNNSPYFAAATGQPRQGRSPSPSKENIHLSYRKGASQIFGTRPSNMAALRELEAAPSHDSPPRRPGIEKSKTSTSHRKSPSLSSIDSGNSPQQRRRSATTAEITINTPSPLGPPKPATVPRIPSSRPELPTSDTYGSNNTKLNQIEPVTHEPVIPHEPPAEPPTPLSPSKQAPSNQTQNQEAAADARRERKVLDLEISNSSLLAINTSLEREVRRQKSELKRFRRLSRAGRFDPGPMDNGAKRNARFSEGLSAVGEISDEDSDAEDGGGRVSGLTDLYEEDSDDDDVDRRSSFSTTSTSNPTGSQQDRRLAEDSRRLEVDLARHKELLVQSQMMNQSLKRCMFATEGMIEEGRRALDWKVRDNVGVGGRVLVAEGDGEGDGGREHDDDATGESAAEISDADGEDEPNWHAGVGDETVRAAEEFGGIWRGVGTGNESNGLGNSGLGVTATAHGGSEAADRDSGIEVDKPPRLLDGSFARGLGAGLGLGRPPENGIAELARGGDEAGSRLPF